MNIKQKLVSIKQSMCNFLDEAYTEQSIKELIKLAQGRSVNHYTDFCTTFLPAMVELDESTEVEVYEGKRVKAEPWVNGVSTCEMCALADIPCNDVPCIEHYREAVGLSEEHVYFVEVT